MRLGSAYHEICAAAKDEEVDLIIIATHGHTGLKHVVLGSTAERVVRHAPCPVLTVRVHEHEFVLADRRSLPANIELNARSAGMGEALPAARHEAP